MTDKRYTVLAATLVLATGASYVATIRPGHVWGDDFAMYIQHARNLAEGQDYSRSGYIYNPAVPYVGPSAYPPVFPLLLAPAYRIFGFDLTPMKAENTAFFCAALFLLFLLFKDRPSPGRALAVVGLMGASPYLWSFKEHILSDMPFLFFTLLALLVLDRASQLKDGGPRSLGRAVLCGFLLYLSFGTRAFGLALVPAMFALDLRNGRRFRKFTWTAAGAFAAFALIQVLLIRGGGEYFDQVFARPLSVAKNLAVYAESLSSLWDNGYSRALQWAFFILTLFLAGTGWRARREEKHSLYEVFLLIYLPSVILLPTRQPRYLIPALPFYFALTLEGLGALTRSKRAKTRAVAAFLALTALFYAGAYSRKSLAPLPEGPHTAESRELFDYIRTRTRAQDVFIFRKPRALALYTERRASFYNPEDDDDGLWRYFEKIGAGYLIVSRALPPDPAVLGPFVERHPERLKLIFANADFTVHRICAAADPPD